MNFFLSKLTVLFFVSTILVSFSCQNELNYSNNYAHTNKVNTLDSLVQSKVKIYSTSKDTEERLSERESTYFISAKQPLETEVSIFVNTKKKFQEYIGIGGAITDASSEVFSSLNTRLQNELLKAYFSDEGINYNIIRTSIHSSDFGLGSYTYIEEGDQDLKTFSIEKDKEKRIPFIKRVKEMIGDDFIFYASPWSPPAFMKTNNNIIFETIYYGSMNRSNQLSKDRYNSIYTLQDYFVKFIKSYENEGIPVWGITIQNEPMATQRWESCIYSAEEERDFLKFFLGPTLKRNGLHKNIVVWDHNRD